MTTITKLNTHIMQLTPEQRADMLIAAQAARQARIAQWKSMSWEDIESFSDRPYWRKLAKAFGVRMPPVYVPGCETRFIRKAMRKCGVTPDQVRDHFGCDVKGLAKQNPRWPAYALIGLVLEIADEECV